jgi:4-nitrophenyl phosphatase
VCDLDGVVWRGDRPIAGSSETVCKLRSRGERVVFVSNNSTATVGDYLSKLERLGMPTTADDLVTSAQAAAELVPAGARALVLGGPGIVEALSARSVEVVDASDAGAGHAASFDHVVVGLDRRLSYERLSSAVSAVLAGAKLIGTNEDPTYPVPEGLKPGGGAVLAAVAVAGGVVPVVAGKPHAPIAATTLRRLGRSNGAGLLVVGDQPFTDGRFAVTLGASFALVLSGVTAAGDVAAVRPVPELVRADLAELVATFDAAG